MYQVVKLPAQLRIYVHNTSEN